MLYIKYITHKYIQSVFRCGVVNCLKTCNRGQSILELIIAIAIFGLIIVAMISMVTGSFVGLARGGEYTQAEALAQEGIEAIKAIYDEAWNELIYSTSSVSVAGNKWIFDGEGTVETIGKFTRIISFNDVCRNGVGEIVVCPGDYTDIHTKEITTEVSWDIREGIINTVHKAGYITNWDSNVWVQTDWSGGMGQSQWVDDTKYDTDDGNVAVAVGGQLSLLLSETESIIDGGFALPAGTSNDWTFTTPSNYIYDSSKIAVTGGAAQLILSGGSTVFGDTFNPFFDTDSSNWTYVDWELGRVDVTGSYIASGGNLGGYVNINIPGRKNATLSGLWEQSFSTTVDNPTIATTLFDWSITSFSGTLLTSYQLYVYVDSFSGAPILGTEVWASGEISGTSAWASVPEIDISAKLGAQGTYYLKTVARAITSGGRGNAGDKTAGFDNIALHFEHATGGSYPTDSPSIYPVNSLIVPGVSNWNNFIEIDTINGGALYYQLSNDNGATWQYWNGLSWVVAGNTDYTNASIVNANIGSFGVTNEQITFRAFLESDGIELVQLDTISIGFSAPAPVWSFNTWNVGGGETIPSGSLHLSGGNPAHYVDIVVPIGGNDEVGGYWEQSFTTVKDNPIPVTVDFDYIVNNFNPSADISQIRIYIDTTSGEPVNQVGTSINVTEEMPWTVANQIDASSAVTTAGTYYLKIAFWVETPKGNNGPFAVGYDNVVLDLVDNNYPLSGNVVSSAFDMGDNSAVQIIEWDENLPCVSCAVELEVSTAPDSGGLPGVWTGWYGALGLGTQFTNASGTMISIDLNNNQWMRYRATLFGDGSDTPFLEEVRVNYK